MIVESSETDSTAANLYVEASATMTVLAIPRALARVLPLVVVAWGLSATLSNVNLRYTMDGTLVNAHSGGLYRFNSTFYLYGTAYENCTQDGPVCQTSCGYYNNSFVAYASPDLVSWTLVNDNLVPGINADSASTEYDEVNVGFCADRGDYVLTFWSGHYGFTNSKIAVARSPSPVGPFTLVEPITATGGTVISDTVGLFVDDDGTAYVRYNTRDAPLRHVVERLSADWTTSTGEHALIFSKQDFPWYDGERREAHILGLRRCAFHDTLHSQVAGCFAEARSIMSC